MLIKLGVDISRLNRDIRRALTVIDTICSGNGEESVLTSTYDGNHSAGSLHYSNDAFDIATANLIDPTLTYLQIKKGLRPGYDVIKEFNHIHIEYDPK